MSKKYGAEYTREDLIKEIADLFGIKEEELLRHNATEEPGAPYGFKIEGLKKLKETGQEMESKTYTSEQRDIVLRSLKNLEEESKGATAGTLTKIAGIPRNETKRILEDLHEEGKIKIVAQKGKVNIWSMKE